MANIPRETFHPAVLPLRDHPGGSNDHGGCVNRQDLLLDRDAGIHFGERFAIDQDFTRWTNPSEGLDGFGGLLFQSAGVEQHRGEAHLAQADDAVQGVVLAGQMQLTQPPPQHTLHAAVVAE